MRRAGGRPGRYAVPSLVIAVLWIAAWGIGARPYLLEGLSFPERETDASTSQGYSFPERETNASTSQGLSFPERETDAPTSQGHSFPKQWNAGEQVSQEAVEAFGLANCFTSERLDDSLFSRAYRDTRDTGKAEGRPRKDDLRYLKVLHYNKEKEIRLGELICHERVSDDLLGIFRALFDAGYPIERMLLIDRYDHDDERSMADNNTSCLNFRLIPGTGKLSNHALGLAVDINPRYNPYVRTAGGKVSHKPRNAAAYVDRSADFPYKIVRGDRCYREFRKRGFTWGGEWKSLKDYQHFERTR